jgi:hypothetical protein
MGKTEMRARVSVSLLFAVLSLAPLSAQTFTSARRDANGRILGTDSNGHAIVVAARGRYSEPELSEDKRTIVWQVLSTMQYHGEPTEVSHRARWYRDGRRHTYSSGDVFIRDVRFVDRGRRLSVNIGAMHFAGLSLLLDADIEKELDRFADADQDKKPAPDWLGQ